MNLFLVILTPIIALLVTFAHPGAVSAAQDARIIVQAGQPGHAISRYLTGACLEDVNHEVYGGIYSQMIFGEHFQEPPSTSIEGFRKYGGSWRMQQNELVAEQGDGTKLISDMPAFANGEVGVEVFLPNEGAGNAGLIVRVSKPGSGADSFDGYEISLDAEQQIVRLGKHRHNWKLLADTPFKVPTGQWIQLSVRMREKTLEVLVNGKSAVQYEDIDQPLSPGTIGIRQWQRSARYRNLWAKTGTDAVSIPFAEDGAGEGEISGMWRAVHEGSATGKAALETADCFAGKQSQRITFAGGEGAFGIENRGLNRWGMCVLRGKRYDGSLWVKAEKQASLFVSLESHDGKTVYAENKLVVMGSEWHKVNFNLTPKSSDASGRFAIKLKQPGSVVLGYAFLEPGEWGRYKGLPVRRDVAEALVKQGITVLRYGGSMINHAEYRWKNMIGPRERRAPTGGTWYPFSSNGWGIPDFLNLCEAAGFMAIPAFNVNESPQDMVDFIEYANGSADSLWGKRRAEDGHLAPYNLTHLQLGNEERVDESYYQKFKALAEAIWARDKSITLVVGDFAYYRPIVDPDNINGTAGGITALDAHRKILRLAKGHNREVWFDVHIATESPSVDGSLITLPTYIDALDKLSEGARYKVAVFELNAHCHNMGRAIGNALAINAAYRDGRLPVVTSANCLQPDGQNDNGWYLLHKTSIRRRHRALSLLGTAR